MSLRSGNSFSALGSIAILLVRLLRLPWSQLLGGSRDQIVDALSHAWIDGSSLRTYRRAERGAAQVVGSGRPQPAGRSPRDACVEGEIGYRAH